MIDQPIYTIKESRKGRSVSNYSQIHKWIHKKLGKATKCSFNISHKAKRYEWANISREYKWLLKDWFQLCPSCHRKYDYTEEQRQFRRKYMLKQTYASKPVKQYSKEGILLRIYSSTTDASRKTGIARPNISHVTLGKLKSAGGYLWSR